MDEERGAVALGVLGCASVLVVTFLPYLFAPGSAMRVYYQTGFGGPPLIALFGVITSIVFLAGHTHRTDPALSAGIVVVFGGFMVLLSLFWAGTADLAAIGGFTDNTLYRHHPWTLPAASFLVTIGAAWYARAVL